MDQNRVDDLLAFALVAAGREDADRFGRHELGPIHLVKYVYLADLAYAATHDGETYSGAPWRFHNFGPWATEVWERIEPVAQRLGARRRTFSSPKAKDDSVRYEVQTEDDTQFERLERALPWEVASTVKRGVREYGSDTTALLRDVYLTKPMLRAAPGAALVFDGEPQPPAAAEPAEEPRLSVRQRRTRAAALEALRERVRRHKEERATARSRRPADPAPPYDEVFAQGVAWLDSLAGDPPRRARARPRSRTKYGHRARGVAAKYPDDSVAALCDAWWAEDARRELGAGRLLRAFVPFPEPKPFELIPEGRAEPTTHQRALFTIRPFDPTRPSAPAASVLPVAGMPLRRGEHYFVVRGKVRPVLVLGEARPRVTADFLAGSASWQTRRHCSSRRSTAQTRTAHAAGGTRSSCGASGRRPIRSSCGTCFRCPAAPRNRSCAWITR